MQEVPGRLWDGKEAILEAIGELIAIEPHCVKPEEDVITALLGAAAARCASLIGAPFLSLSAHKQTLPCSSHCTDGGGMQRSCASMAAPCCLAS